MSENVCFMVKATLKKILILSIFLLLLQTELKTNCRVTGKLSCPMNHRGKMKYIPIVCYNPANTKHLYNKEDVGPTLYKCYTIFFVFAGILLQKLRE